MQNSPGKPGNLLEFHFSKVLTTLNRDTKFLCIFTEKAQSWTFHPRTPDLAHTHAGCIQDLENLETLENLENGEGNLENLEKLPFPAKKNLKTLKEGCGISKFS